MKDFDSADRAQNFRTAGLSMFGGVVFAVAGARIAGVTGFVIGWILGAIVIYFSSQFLAERAASAAASLYVVSGSSTPPAREYSLAQTLAVQGRFEEAAEEYERCAVVFDADPQPRLQLARLLRDRLKKPEEAAHWFHEVLRMPNLDPALEMLAVRELVELYANRMKQPERALPVVARYSERPTDSPLAQWARQELEELRTLPRGAAARD